MGSFSGIVRDDSKKKIPVTTTYISLVQVYSKHRGSRVSYPGAGFGAAYAKALAMNNVTLIPRREEDMVPNLVTSTRAPLPDNWIITTARSVLRPTNRPTPRPKPTTNDPFILYNQLKSE